LNPQRWGNPPNPSGNVIVATFHSPVDSNSKQALWHCIARPHQG
jgi:hypothetical protein